MIRIGAKEKRIKKNKNRLTKSLIQKTKRISKFSKKLQNLSIQDQVKILETCKKEFENIKVLGETLNYIDEDLTVNDEDFYKCEILIDNLNDQANMCFEEAKVYQQKRDRLLETKDLIDNLPRFPQMLAFNMQQNRAINDIEQREENVLVPN